MKNSISNNARAAASGDAGIPFIVTAGIASWSYRIFFDAKFLLQMEFEGQDSRGWRDSVQCNNLELIAVGYPSAGLYIGIFGEILSLGLTRPLQHRG